MISEDTKKFAWYEKVKKSGQLELSCSLIEKWLSKFLQQNPNVLSSAVYLCGFSQGAVNDVFKFFHKLTVKL